jgi:MFS family permease
MPRLLNSDQWRIFAAAFLRALGIGMTAVMVGIYLSEIGWHAGRIGLLIGLGFAGAATGTLLVSFFADRLGRRQTLMAFAVLNAAGGLALATTGRPTLLLAAAFIGMINGLGRARGAVYALEQAVLPETTTPERRTSLLAWYGVALDGGSSVGSLLAGVPYLLRTHWGWALLPSYHAVWYLSAGLYLLSLPLYAGLSKQVEVESAGRELLRITPESRRTIGKLAGLVAMDALGGGFITKALVAYWFFERFHAGEQWLAPLFMVAGVANAASQPIAAWLSKRWGLINTMVFTHVPSSLFLIAVPFAPGFAWAALLFLARESLVEMDVPTRQSYILAVVRSEERSFAIGMTTFTRNVARIFGATLAGYAMSIIALASPLFIGGGIKIAYDLLLYVSFRRIPPPEEKQQ